MSGPENRLESLNHARPLRDGKIRFDADEWVGHKDRRVRHGRAIAVPMNAAQGSYEQTSLKRSTRANAPDYFAGLRELQSLARTANVQLEILGKQANLLRLARPLATGTPQVK